MLHKKAFVKKIKILKERSKMDQTDSLGGNKLEATFEGNKMFNQLPRSRKTLPEILWLIILLCLLSNYINNVNLM
jgi:hypothetical protein